MIEGLFVNGTNGTKKGQFLMQRRKGAEIFKRRFSVSQASGRLTWDLVHNLSFLCANKSVLNLDSRNVKC